MLNKLSYIKYGRKTLGGNSMTKLMLAKDAIEYLEDNPLEDVCVLSSSYDMYYISGISRLKLSDDSPNFQAYMVNRENFCPFQLRLISVDEYVLLTTIDEAYEKFNSKVKVDAVLESLCNFKGIVEDLCDRAIGEAEIKIEGGTVVSLNEYITTLARRLKEVKEVENGWVLEEDISERVNNKLIVEPNKHLRQYDLSKEELLRLCFLEKNISKLDRIDNLELFWLRSKLEYADLLEQQAESKK